MQERAALGVAAAPRADGIALCLSGGGFRAALFHLGATRRLHELGVLQRAAAISAVSGGSIFAAFLATRFAALRRAWTQGAADWQREIADPFRAFCARDLRTVPVLAHLLWNWAWPTPLVRHLEARYRARLTRLRLCDLPESPRIVLCSTDLTYGVNWEFSRHGAQDYRVGRLPEAAEWPLARAVAASACFPPIFGPMRVGALPSAYRGGRAGPDRDPLLRGIQLSDGGVYDNMGLEPVWKDWSTILVSDCGAPFDFKVDRTPWSRLLRYTAVVTNQTRALRLRSFFRDTGEAGRYRGAYWSLTSGLAPGVGPVPASGVVFAGYSRALATDVIDRVRTDLDAFTPAEMSVLENHGYFAVDRSLRKHLPDLLPAAAPAATAPYPDWTDEERVRHALRDSHRLVSVRRLLGFA
ncbi:MAG TPA: patatin-like phospholipase family protein [Candidatus Polarisedimenticolia bacterium]|nr:patatin-like phospholipase family protein [Candidatus Polarisedimenticolia bacterium]